MDVVIAGAHGKVGRHLTRLLTARGDQVRGLIRNSAHADDVIADGATAVVCDLESAPDEDVDEAVGGATAIVFAAGAGPGSGAERKWTVDYGAAKRLVEAAQRLGIGRYVMVSAMGTDDPPPDDEVFSVYLRAKAQADEELRAAGLDHTIVRPGVLTDDPGTGLVQLARHVSRGQIPREDVAAVVAEVLATPGTAQRTFELVGGDTPITDAVASAGGTQAGTA
jgi:nucleoside-diphosphate-sugar epimerase